MKDICNELLEHISTLEVIDTHEHLPCREEDRDMGADVLQEYLGHYYNRDLVSAGLSMTDYERVIEEEMSVGERWKLVEPYWEACRYTGYGRSLDISARDIYGVERIDGSTIEELDGRFEAAKRPGHFRKILKDKCRIKTSLLNVETLSDKYDPRQERSIHCDRELFSPVYRLEDLVHPNLRSQVKKVEKQSGHPLTGGWKQPGCL